MTLLIHTCVQLCMHADLLVEEWQHWIATSLFKGELHLYDSCFNGTLSPSTELAPDSTGVQPINSMWWAVDFCGGSPAARRCKQLHVDYSALLLRITLLWMMTWVLYNSVWRAQNELIKCFEKGKLSRFPRTKKATPKRPAPQTIAITIYCMCKRPDSFEDMVMCDRCYYSGITIVVRKSAKNQQVIGFVLVVLLYDLCTHVVLLLLKILMYWMHIYSILF